ncbi:aminotransferase class III-fold pyridoxal phosphate-dependent enzyme [Amycolatopsis pithecellobii]|uniref:Aminotransferase class III-fold pyridoxal phosphate-dependent enzyme n=1 Tax=Amycolatopsis pithecellobii TaxID=664692 RepID=A0A6N7YZ55_9PSEU|nr:aminotransferase class III-fold pyridoxal phosphate-dependent enzyme [Amycolatopsis pithecellobii]MTD52450.1 aminotransferase class III-fold pyridoxal phosphate-dependent enzyme [Amycolatopsis pithecellobii]
MTSVTADDAGKATLMRLPEHMLTAALLRYFDITCAAGEQLGGEIDQNFKVIDQNGQLYFVRVTRADPSSVDLAWQNTLLRHLASTVPELPVPRLVRTASGDDQVALSYAGTSYVVRVMSWLRGRPLVEIPHHPKNLLRELGTMAGRMNLGLSGLARPDGLAGHDWDVLRGREIIDSSISFIDDRGDAAHVGEIMTWFDDIRAELPNLPHCVVHHDLNDANVLADLDENGALRISGMVDVGDAMYSARAVEVAIAAGYAMLRKDDPLTAAAEVVAGFHAVVPITAEELAVIYPLAATRLCMNAVTWYRRVAESGSEYGRSRSRHVWPTIRKLTRTPPDLAEAIFRAACALPPEMAEGVKTAGDAIASSLGPARHLDATPAADIYDDLDWTDQAELRAAVRSLLDGRPGVLAHLDASLMWSGPGAVGSKEPATARLGATVLLDEGTEVRVPIHGIVEHTAAEDRPLVLRHEVDGAELYTCWWNLECAHRIGDELALDARLGVVGPRPVEPGFGPGVQVQLLASAQIATWPPPRRIRPSQRAAWEQLSADPVPMPRDIPGKATASTLREFGTVRLRAGPMNFVRGRDVWLFDGDGLGYLDALSTVAPVGHAEPRITAVATRQMRKLVTGSGFVSPQVASYVKKLVATLPAPLEVVFLVRSGDEANELAVRMARQVTGREHVVAVEGSFCGSIARYATHEVRIPDRYRGPYGYGDPGAGSKYASDAASVIERIDADGRRPAAFIGEPLMGQAGTVVLPEGYLAGVHDAARKAGALCISDEVQTGVGRLGPWWGFESQNVIPDIVTMGESLGNGHPLGAVVTTREIAGELDGSTEYFSEFSGNPVSCAIGEAVLDIVDGDGLRENAVEVGDYFAYALRELQHRQPLIGEVRAHGLSLGVELVRDRETKEPARREASVVAGLALNHHGVMVFPAGVHENVLTIRPPLTFRREHVDRYVETLDQVLSLPELSARPNKEF